MVRFQLLFSRLHPGCQEHGPFAQSTWATLWAHFCQTRVASFQDHLHLSPGSGLSPKSVISLTMVCRIAPQWAISVCCPFSSSHRWWWPRSHSLRTGLFSRPRPRLRDLADGPTIRLQRCLSIAVSVTLLLEIWYTACPSAQAVSVCSWHSWIFDTTSLLNSPGTLRVPVRFVGAVCRRFSEPVP